MSSILEVNERGAYAVIEPGVTFRDLSEYCLENKRSVWPNVPSIGWGSVIGNVCVAMQCQPLSLSRSFGPPILVLALTFRFWLFIR